MRASAHVERFLLYPQDLLVVRVSADEREDLLLGERIQQLDPSDRDSWRLRPQRVADDVVVDLAAAEQQAGDLLRIHAGLGQDRLEAAGGKVLHVRGGRGEAQKTLWGHDPQR